MESNNKKMTDWAIIDRIACVRELSSVITKLVKRPKKVVRGILDRSLVDDVNGGYYE